MMVGGHFTRLNCRPGPLCHCAMYMETRTFTAGREPYAWMSSRWPPRATLHATARGRDVVVFSLHQAPGRCAGNDYRPGPDCASGSSIDRQRLVFSPILPGPDRIDVPSAASIGVITPYVYESGTIISRPSSSRTHRVPVITGSPPDNVQIARRPCRDRPASAERASGRLAAAAPSTWRVIFASSCTELRRTNGRPPVQSPIGWAAALW